MRNSNRGLVKSRFFLQDIVMLDVQQSLMRARWKFAVPDISDVSEIVTRYGLPEIVARLLASRQVPIDDIGRFLNPSLKRDFPDPFTLAGMKDAAEYLAQAIIRRKKPAIFGDFDVDGATSSALLCRFFRHFGIDAPVYIPDRLTEGYGPNAAAFADLKNEGAEIVVLCDCGSTAFEPIESAAAMGLEVIVLDHHETEEILPCAAHVVNPKRQDCNAGLQDLAAVGVTFLTCVAVNNILRKHGFLESSGCGEFPLKQMLDIVALGTVCDMVPLKGFNRLLVRSGLQMISASSNPGIRALIQVSGASGPLSPYHLGFILGPRINSGSRVKDSTLGARLLSTDDDAEAVDLAWRLEEANNQRKNLQSKMYIEALGKAEKVDPAERRAIVVTDEGWHAGLAGLVAGRLKEHYKCPVAVIAFSENSRGEKEGRGSCRSVPGVNVAQTLIDAKGAGLLIKGGGHAMAGGFTILPENISDFSSYFTKHVMQQMDSVDAVSDTHIDGVLSIRGVNLALYKLLETNLGPFGEGNPEPVFAFPQVRILSAEVVGDGHVRLLVTDWEGGARISAVAFRAADTDMGKSLLKGRHQLFHLAGILKSNSWQGNEKVEIHINDAARAIAGESRVAAEV